MKSQKELLQGSDIPTDDLPDHKFSADDIAYLQELEVIAFQEWERVCGIVGLCATVDTVTENYDLILHNAGRWTLDYSSAGSLEK